MLGMPELTYVDPESFLIDSFLLGRKVYLSGFRPKHAISIWRGGTPVGLGVDAFFRSRGLSINHTTIATDSYQGISQQGEVIVKNLEHLVQVICPEDGLLIVDDVYESGKTIQSIVELLRKKARANAPREIRVACIHNKPVERRCYHELPLISLHDVEPHLWIDYPHELADLVSDDDPNDDLIKTKGDDIWEAVRTEAVTQEVQGAQGDYYYPSARQLHLDSIRLGAMVSQDQDWHPNFMIALWPGGVVCGLPVHEMYKYSLRKGNKDALPPDHISVNTIPGRASYDADIIGLHYLLDHIESGDNVLIVDTAFRAGRLVNDLVLRLKEALRRNLDLRRVRVASGYYNPEDKSTWTSAPLIKRPHYFLKEVHQEVISPWDIHKLPNPRRDLKTLNPELWRVLFEEWEE